MGNAAGREQVILGFVSDYIAGNGLPPTLREIAAGCGLASTNSVRYWLERLERNGQIRRNRVISRGIVVVPREA